MGVQEPLASKGTFHQPRHIFNTNQVIRTASRNFFLAIPSHNVVKLAQNFGQPQKAWKNSDFVDSDAASLPQWKSILLVLKHG